jgi:hypothetical protein
MISQQRTGPAIRYWEFARVLSLDHAVTLLVTNEDHPLHPDFLVRTCGEDEIDTVAAGQQVVVIQGPALQLHPRLTSILAAGRHHVVVDLYDPVGFEQLAIDPKGQIGRHLHLEYWALVNEQLRVGDFFLCASERQRDYWLGALGALGRLNHDTWDGHDFRQLIDLVPFGLPPETPRLEEPVLKTLLPHTAAQDRVILWGGGLWDWLDPLTPIRAMERVCAHHPSARLLFFDLARGQTDMAKRAQQLSADLGMLGREVLFVEWVASEHWGACLLEGDIGLSFHPPGVETRFAFRTRLLDYIWAGLPIVTASGDALSELVATHQLGYVVEPGDLGGLADALIALLGEDHARETRREAFRRLAAELTWEQVTEPLRRYCQEPWRASDSGPSFVKRWQTAGHDRILAEAALAYRQLREVEAQARQMEERASPSWQVAQMQSQLATMSRQLAACETNFQAAMNGRVMRLMTGLQRAIRRVRRKPPEG